MRFLSGFLAAIALLIALGLALLWTGAYNVAASAGHSDIGRSIFETMMVQSVKARAENPDLSAKIRRTADLQAGFREFQEYCIHCHGAPGAEPHEWTRGMVPQPPELSEAAAQWTPAQTFWIAKHGIKMTGMPAFGGRKSDQTLVNIAGFLDRMEGMTPEQYQALQQRWGSAGGQGGDGESGAGRDGHGHSHDPGAGH
ncbi:MAG TPA: cytochrome c [Sphingomicrobium sp.]|nr:cytochrome c [Sphingomicrobium sp.]